MHKKLRIYKLSYFVKVAYNVLHEFMVVLLSSACHKIQNCALSLNNWMNKYHYTNPKIVIDTLYIQHNYFRGEKDLNMRLDYN